MSQLVKNGRAVPNEWKLLRLSPGESPQNVRLPVGQVLVPWSVWQARRRELVHREYEHGWALGVWFPADDIPQSMEHEIDNFSVVAIELERVETGNSHSIPALLRSRYNYTAELRAFGDISQDRHATLQHAGFDAIQLQGIHAEKTILPRLHNFNRAGTAALGQVGA